MSLETESCRGGGIQSSPFPILVVLPLHVHSASTDVLEGPGITEAHDVSTLMYVSSRGASVCRDVLLGLPERIHFTQLTLLVAFEA